MKGIDYLIVGSGLFGATFAYRAKQAGKEWLVMINANIYVTMSVVKTMIR